MYVGTRLFFLTTTKLVLRVQQIASIVVQVALQKFSYDGKIVHIVPIMYTWMHFYNIDKICCFQFLFAYNKHKFKLNHVVSSF